MKKFLTSSVIGSIILSLLVVTAPVAVGEECLKNNLTSLFFEEYFGDVKWDNRVAPREITWSTEVTSINGVATERKFTAIESGWLQESFDSWDIALDTINFRRVTDQQSARILVGLGATKNNGLWSVEQRGNFRESGTILITSISPFAATRSGFIEITQSEIGNLLGLGDIAENSPVDSVMKDPDTAPFGSIPLSDFDIDLVRQFYGESTCRSSWSQPLKDSKAAAVAEAQAKADAESREALSKMALLAEVARKAQEKVDRAEVNAFKASLKKRKTITCIKQGLVKKVTGINPACPKGYKKG